MGTWNLPQTSWGWKKVSGYAKVFFIILLAKDFYVIMLLLLFGLVCLFGAASFFLLVSLLTQVSSEPAHS